MDAVSVTGLTKTFGNTTAVDAITFSIKKGELFGFLGPNGAGKTTTIKMLATLLDSTAGTATVWGKNVRTHRQDVRKVIGIVFQDPSVDDELTGKENLDFHARMYGMSASKRKERIHTVLQLVDLEDKASALVKTYSGGMRRRLEIARGLMHFPKVLFLDEPTLGLDPQTRRKIWNYIKKLNKEEGMTILLTTHYMEEADELCSRIGIIDQGTMVAIGTPQKLKKDVGEDLITITTKYAEQLEPLIIKAGLGNTIIHNNSLTLSTKEGEKKVVDVMRLADSKNLQIDAIRLRKPTLEDAFLQYTGKTIREEEARAKDAFRQHSRLWRGRK